MTMRNTIAFAVLAFLLTGIAARSEFAQSGVKRSAPPPSPSPSPSISPSPSPSAEPAKPENDPQPSGNQPSERVDEQVGPGDVLRVETTLVTVPVSITDRDGRYIADLRKEDFHVYEDGIEQNIAYFAAVEKPFTVVLMLDTSTSTWSKLRQIKQAAIAFVEQLRPDDQVMVVSFASGLTIKSEATTDREKTRKAINGTGRGLSTHLYDAMSKLMKETLNRNQGRRALVLFTDGVDAKSKKATYESTVYIAEELDVLIYPILYDTYDPASDTSNSSDSGILSKIPIFGGGKSNGTSRAEYDRGEQYLRDLARLTGGRLYEASPDLSYLQDAFSKIADELRRQYSVGYYPRRKDPAERRRIKVRVNRPNALVRARDSYVYRGETAEAANPPAAGTDQGATPPVLKKKPFTSNPPR
jgi:Ca-activated chloride channel homolog